MHGVTMKFIQDMLSYSLKHAFQNLFPSIKCKCTTTTKETGNIIMSLKSSNSFGYDEVPTKTLKLRFPFINSLLNYMYNRTLLTGVFPNRLKHGFIRPLLKRGNNNDISNYRPISTSFSKMSEKVMHTALLKHLTDHNILSNKQQGFRTKKLIMLHISN